MKVCLAGHGAFGIKHLEAMAKIPDIEVISLAGSNMESAREIAQQWKIPHWTANLAESLAQPGLDAVILTTPTQMHAAQGEQCMRAGKHVMIEIPMADSVADSERLVRIQKETGVVAMAGHTRRFNPSHQWIHKRILAGELKVLQMDAQTYFFRRTNMNALEQVFTRSCLIFVPPGVKHCPLLIRRVDRPIFHFSTVTSGRYEPNSCD